MSLTVIFKEAWYFFKSHLKFLAIVFIPLLLLQVGIQYWLMQQVAAQMDVEMPVFGIEHGVAMTGLLIVFAWLISALTLFMQMRSEGFYPTPNKLLFGCLGFVPSLLLAGVFSGLVVIAPTMIAAAMGPLWIFGLVISAYFFARFAFVNFMVVTEHLTPLAAMKRSFTFSKGMVLPTMSVLSIYIPISMIGGIIEQAMGGGIVAQVLLNTVIAFISLYVNIALFRLYMLRKQDPLHDNDLRS